MTGYTVTINFLNPVIGSWDGFGTSLAWWANAIGGSQYEQLYADILFTTNTVLFRRQSLPGLGLNIVRYNIGGTGRQGDIPGIAENFEGQIPVPWYTATDGYWINPISNDTASNSFDWTRDPRQRSMLAAATNRNVSFVEFISYAPMWWMTDVKSSMGGSLLPNHTGDFSYYVASVVDHAVQDWGINVHSVEILNEPSAGFWRYPAVNQEGCNVNNSVKVELFQGLRGALQMKGRNNILVSGADEHNPHQGIGSLPFVQPYVDQVNVHGYASNDQDRKSLRALVMKKFWMTETNDGSESGMALAESITKDINVMGVSGWVYWQAISMYPGGVLYADYKTASNFKRGEPRGVPTKYFVFAQFTRFILPGDQILQNSDENTVVARNPVTNRFKIVTVNYGNAQWISYQVAGIGKNISTSVTFTYTNSNGSGLFQTFENPVWNMSITFWAAANTIYSVEI